MNRRLKLSVLSLVVCLALAPCMSLATLQPVPIEGCVNRELTDRCSKEANSAVVGTLMIGGMVCFVASALTFAAGIALKKYSTYPLSKLACVSAGGLLLSLPIMLAGVIISSERTDKCCNQVAKRTQCFYDE